MNLQNVKKALYAILGKDANDEGDVCYWVEASEIIEHLMAKYNANPIPNIYAECLLKQQVVLDNDGVHYTRCIEHQDECRKMIFGFTNKEFYNQIVNEYEDEYTDLKWFMDKIQKNDWNLLYSKDYPANIVEDLGIVNVLANSYEYDMLDCLTTNMYDYLVVAKTELEEYQRKKPNPQVENCIDFAELMLELPKLECFEI